MGELCLVQMCWRGSISEMKDKTVPKEASKPEASAIPKRSYLFWANVLVLLPFTVLVARASATGSGVYLFWAFMISPAALVTLGLDIYTAVQHYKNK